MIIHNVNTFNEHLELIMPDGTFVETDFQCKLQCEEELVVLIQTAASVAKRFERQIFDDVRNSFAVDGRLL